MFWKSTLYSLLASLRPSREWDPAEWASVAQWSSVLRIFCFALCSRRAPGANVLRGICMRRRARWLAAKALARYFVYFLLSPWSSLFWFLEEVGCWNDWLQLMCARESSLVISGCCCYAIRLTKVEMIIQLWVNTIYRAAWIKAAVYIRQICCTWRLANIGWKHNEWKHNEWTQ